MVFTETYRSRKEYGQRSNPVGLAFLISHKSTGSNLQAATDAINRGEIKCKVQLVVSEKNDVAAVEVVKANNLPLVERPLKKRKSLPERDAYGKELAELLNNNGVQVAILEGFTVILSHAFFETFQGVVLNIHPGLIPDERDKPFIFPDGTEAPWNKGLITEDAVKNFLGGKYAGSTWHVATEEADFGPVLNRVIVDVLPDDSVETLYPRLKKAEHKGLIEVLKNPPLRSLSV